MNVTVVCPALQPVTHETATATDLPFTQSTPPLVLFQHTHQDHPFNCKGTLVSFSGHTAQHVILKQILSCPFAVVIWIPKFARQITLM